MVVRFIGLNSVKFREQEVDQIRTLIIYDLVVILNRNNYEKMKKKIFSLAIFLLISYIIYIILIILIGNKNSVKPLIPKVQSHYFSSIRLPLALLYNLIY